MDILKRFALHKRDTLNEFEESTRHLRWICLAIAALTFPPGAEQTPLVYALITLAAVYNLTRYSRRLLGNRLFSSPAFIIGADLVFAVLIVMLAGRLGGPYSPFLIFMIISAAYRYRLKGVAIVVAAEATLLYTIGHIDPFPAIEPSTVRAVIIYVSILLALGRYVERLTHIDRQERDMLRKLSVENETERSHLLALIDSLKSAAFVVSDKGRVILHNGMAAALSDRSGSIRGKQLDKLLPLHVRTDAKAKHVSIIKEVTSPQHRRDLCLSGANGQIIDLDITVKPVRLEGFRTTDYIVICEDITSERSLDEERSEFISVASHELRTPVAIMEAALSTLLHSNEDYRKETRVLLEQAHDNSLLLGGIIKDLSTLAQAKNDNIPVKLEPIDPTELAGQIVQEFKAQTDKKGLKLKLTVDRRMLTVLSTERHIREILQNYMTNAIKYSQKGTITVAVEATISGGAIFSVKDTGLGISAGDQKYLFNKFFRAEDYRIRKTGGTGLGLYLCRELAERLGGRVWCQSELNKGSTFYLEIPQFSKPSHGQDSGGGKDNKDAEVKL